MAGKIAELGETDAFVAAMHWKMARAGQGRHLSCSVLVLDGVADVAALRRGLAEVLRRHPMLVSEVGRPWPWTRLWHVRSRRAVSRIPLGLWRERGVAETVFPEDSRECEGKRRLLEELLNGGIETGGGDGGTCDVRLDVIALGDGSTECVLTWSHMILDGVGAEWLLMEIAGLAADPEAESVAPGVVEASGSPHRTAYERWQATRPMLEYLNEVIAKGVFSLAGQNDGPSRLAFDCVHLDERTTSAIGVRAAKICGPLIQTHFFLACAIVAHDAVWRRFRGGSPPVHMVALPVQQRVRGKPGPIFRNNVSVMFFTARPEELHDLDRLTESLLRQQQQVLKRQLMASFSEMKRWMKVLPSPLYSMFLDFQMKGQNTAFHHSNTGTFARELTSFAGCGITNAWHVPGLFSPPGSGLFLSDRGGRITVSVSWREGALKREEAACLRDAFLAAMTGDPGSCGAG